MSFTSLLLGLLLTFSCASHLYAQPTCSKGEILQNNKCVECPVGTYRKNKTKCRDCPPGTSQPHTGAVAVDLCRACTPGTYSDKPASPTCKPCPKRTTSNFKATKCSRCGPGTKAVRVGNGCKECKPGSYSSGVANQECQDCPGLFISNPGSKSVKDCRPCQPDKPDNNCPFCGENWYLSPKRDRCLPCPSGTFSKRKRATSIDQCRPCPRNTFFSRSADKCKPCKPGTFTNGPGASVCRAKDEKCTKDFFENENGDCVRCSPGWVYVKGENRCEMCPAGSVSKGSKQTKCIKCKGGMIPGFRNRICECPPGTFYVNAKVCLPCPPGTYNPNEGHTDRECFECTKGTFSKKKGATSCERCPYGLVALKERAMKCTKCPAGTMPDMELHPFNYIHGSAQCMSTKTRCPLGYRRQTVGARRSFFGCKHVACRVGTPKEEIYKTCAPCEVGHHLVGEGKRCGRCPRREVSDGGIITVCKKCKNGLFQDERDRSKCSCYGYFALGFGLQNGICKKCPPGTIGAYTSEKCVACPPGTFAKGVGNDICASCAVGTISGKGATSCRKCPKGTVANKRRRATKCVPDA